MLVRNSTGRNVSLLNDESTAQSLGDRPSQQRSSLPSISAFLPQQQQQQQQQHQQHQSNSQHQSWRTRKDSHASSACHSPFDSTSSRKLTISASSGHSSPTLSECSTQLDAAVAATTISSSSYSSSSSAAASGNSPIYSPVAKKRTLFGVTRPTPLLHQSASSTTSSSLPSLSRSSSSTSSLSQYNNNTPNNNNSVHTPLTPNSPHSTSYSSSTHHLDAMDHAKTAYQSHMLTPSALTTDAFMYGVHRNSLPTTNQYFSIAQQPLPQGPIPLTASSPPMYSMDSPTTSINMMDSYLPLQQQQQQAVPFAPYPQELIPGSLSRPSNAQSIIATSPSDTSNNSAPKMAKKKYPCPHAAKYNCSDTFTTSGHAARHGKKHTGEKNIHCPVCDKAFTRKDNMKQHERTHRNKGEASKVAEAVETSKRASHQATLSKSSTHSSTDIETDDNLPKVANPQATIRAAQQQRRPNISTVQQAPPSLTSPTAADIPMPVTLDSGETLQPVAPSLQVEPMDKNFSNIFDHSFISRSQENILGRPAIFERTTSTGSGFSADGEGESPGLDALAMAAELC